MKAHKALRVLQDGGEVLVDGVCYCISNGRLCVVAGGQMLRSHLTLDAFINAREIREVD